MRKKQNNSRSKHAEHLNMDRLDQAGALALLHRGGGQVAVVRLVLMHYSNLGSGMVCYYFYSLLTDYLTVNPLIHLTQSPGFSTSEFPNVATYVGYSFSLLKWTPVIMWKDFSFISEHFSDNVVLLT